ncbi:MAG: tRNA adenosine(34) deaminase TadA [Lachnospiraceae bacterium]|nr:tRNA adenosine(34) deaminase TadA [Lachnospiraceae bacterium]
MSKKAEKIDINGLKVFPVDNLSAFKLKFIKKFVEECEGWENRKYGELSELEVEKSQVPFLFVAVYRWKIVGLLIARAFDLDSYEVFALTHPSLRHQGIFSRLLRETNEVLTSFGNCEIISMKLHPTSAFLYDYSEYVMSLSKKQYVSLKEEKEPEEKVLSEEQRLDLMLNVIPSEFFEEEDKKPVYSVEVFDMNPTQKYAEGHVKNSEGYALEFTCDIEVREKAVFLSNVYVNEECRGKGLGTRYFGLLLEKLFEDENLVSVKLQVSSKNIPACKLYQKYNFKISEEVSFYRYETQEMLDKKYMKEALEEAKKAAENGDVPIGCVIVKDKEIIARGYNRRNFDNTTLSHAELIAISEANKYFEDWRVEGCTMYVTLEPCPMCAGSIVQARIPRVVIGAMNSKAGCAGSVINLLDIKGFNHRCEVVRGICEEECSTILSDFFKSLRKKKEKG